MKTLAIFPADQIIDLIPRAKAPLTSPDGQFNVRLNSSRLRCFKRSLACVSCGVVGTTFRLQQQQLPTLKVSNSDYGWRHGVHSCYIEQCHICSMYRGHQSKEERPHLNLFAPGLKGWHHSPWVMMTQDHVQPQSRGGSSELDNLATMCSKCNSTKGSSSVEEFASFTRLMNFPLLHSWIDEPRADR